MVQSSLHDRVTLTLKHYDVKRCLHRIIEEHAVTNPASTAVIDGEAMLSYEALNLQANHIAALILRCAIPAGSFVGVYMERSAELVVSIVGVLKAGCAWIPLDPSNPSERLRFVIEDASIALTITQERFRDCLPASHPLLITGQKDELVGCPEMSSNPEASCTPSAVAYVIYTSGSTGKPKGVCCHHLGVLNLLDDFQSRQPLLSADRCSWWSNSGFDVSVYEIFAPLIAGSTLVVVPEEVRHDVTLLMDWLSMNRITSAYLPPMMIEDYRAWVMSHQGSSQLRRLLTGVEPLPEKLLLDISAAVPGLTVINGYGPTETTVCATLYTVVPGSTIRRNTPIGKPLQNMHLHLMDDDGNDVAPGETGEIGICGAGVSHGYLNRQELNARLFVADPCSGDLQLPMYRTGDLGYLLADGNLMFAGRKDFQFKHMGYRIEPGEIESVLRSHEAVRDAVVMLRDLQPGVRHLVGYVTCRSGWGVTPSHLDSFLLKALPQYMIPSAFVVLDAIPVTANGKTDRAALPLPGKPDFPGGKAERFRGSETPEELEIVSMFSALLGVEHIDVDDNFFSLGGNSLIATRLASRIRLHWGVSLPLEFIFRNPNARALANEIQERQQTGDVECIPENRPPIELFPATWLQKGMWLLQQLQEEGTILNIPVIVTINGSLDGRVLKKAFEYLVARHESMRSVFSIRKDELVQQVLPEVRVPWTERDLSGLDEAERTLLLETIRKEEGACRFDYAQGPLFRIFLVRTGRVEFRLFFTISHLIIDGWSAHVLFREWFECYDALSQGVEPHLSEQKLFFSDVALWQHRRSGEAVVTGQIDYWLEKLREWPLSQELPSDNQRPPVQSWQGARYPVVFSIESSEAIRAFCIQNSCTPFMFLMAVFQVLLHRYSARSRIISGTTIANRNNLQTEEIVGLFVNNLAIVTDFSGNPDFRKILAQVRNHSLEAFGHQDAPFGLVADKLIGYRDRSRHPVFQNLFILQNTPSPVFRAGEVRFEYEEVGNETAKLDLLMNIELRDSLFTGWIEYNTDLFRRTTIGRLAADYIRIAEHALSGVLTEVASWPLPSIPVVEEVTPFDADTPLCCHHRFEQQARLNPDRIALQFDERRLTYRELDHKANRLAHYLIEKGVAPDVPVGLCMEKSPELYIGLLGILKAGGAWVPVDPAYPEDRIRFMLSDSGMFIAVTNTAVSERLRIGTSIDAVVLDALEETLRELPADTPVRTTSAGHLAYIMYTSGSTGTPKGVMVTHGGVTNLARSAVSRYSIRANDRVLQFFSISFDGSVEEMFMTLTCGATLVVRDFSLEMPVREFFNRIERSGVTVLDLPTAFWHEVVASLKSSPATMPQALRLLIIGGEQATLSDYQDWKRITGGRVGVINTYGPTECTVVSLCSGPDFEGVIPDGIQAVPIGLPMENTNIAVVSEQLSMMPAGMPGELLIGGHGVARGYLNASELTRQKFIDSISCNGVLRGPFYRTGDQVRFLENGALQFLGRMDSQVKIRGFRIEPGEIEVALNRHPQVMTSVVTGFRNQSSEMQLAAYFIPEGMTPASSDLRDFLHESLPEYMVPVRFISMESFPQLPNGKIDRNALPNPGQSIDTTALFVAPESDLERTLVTVWEEVLGVQPVGIRDDFFTLGGHSLLAVRLCSRIEEVTGISVKLSSLFRNLTIEALAARMHQEEASSDTTCSVMIQKGSTHHFHPPLFIIHVLGTGLKFCRPMVSHLGSDIPVYGISVHLLEVSPASARSVGALAQLYVQEVKKIRHEPPYLLAGISFGGIVALEMARIMNAENDEVRLVALLDSILRDSHLKLDTPDRIRAHRENLGKQGISYLAIKLRDRMQREIAELFARVEHSVSMLKLGYYKARRSTAFMPIELKEFAARLDNDEAWHNYQPTPYDGKITLFKSADQVLGVSDLADPLLGWGEVVTGGIEVIDCPGNHLSMLADPHAKTLAEKLRESIDKAVHKRM